MKCYKANSVRFIYALTVLNRLSFYIFLFKNENPSIQIGEKTVCRHPQFHGVYKYYFKINDLKIYDLIIFSFKNSSASCFLQSFAKKKKH